MFSAKEKLKTGEIKVPDLMSFCTVHFNQSTVCKFKTITVTGFQVDNFIKNNSFFITASYFSTL